MWQQHVSTNRTLNCTHELACNHLDDLTEESIPAGIMKNSQQLESGAWNSEIFTSRWMVFHIWTVVAAAGNLLSIIAL